ncbi:MAG: conjugal transfer protein TraX [Firmicutes bacterium]|nr:conjugal transfer protein TraX [Bacillota bacterium]
MTKKLNRDFIKILIVALVFVDHIGYALSSVLPQWLYISFRCIGRIFPMVCYLIADSFYYTHNTKKFITTLLIFGVISVVPSYLMQGRFVFNVLFTYALSCYLMLMYNKLYRENTTQNKTKFIVGICIISFVVLVMDSLGIGPEYGLYGVLLPFVFYVLRDNKQSQCLAFLILFILNFLYSWISYSVITQWSLIQIFSLLNIVLIINYNGKKGKINAKYLFYWAYPLSMLIPYLIKLIVL